MTYRELRELDKAGELELEQRKKVEQDIEKQEAISDYLYEQEDIPELDDIFGEKTSIKGNDEKNRKSNGKHEESEKRKDREARQNRGDEGKGNKGEKKDREKLKEEQSIKSKIYKKKTKKNDDIEDVDTEFIKMVNCSIRRAFRRLGMTVLAAAFVLILFVQFCLPTIVSCFYYNPTEKIGKDVYSNIKMSRDMAVYSELFLPGKRRMSVSAEVEGYGKYNISVNQTASLTGTMTNVSGEIRRGKIRYYDSNILTKPESNVFVYGGIGNIIGDEDKSVEDNLETTRKYYNLEDNEEVNFCAAGTKEDSLETLKELDSKKLYIGYVSLDKYMSYENFKKYIDKQDLSEVWCAVKTSDVTAESEEGNKITHLYNFSNIGFVCNPSYTIQIDWDNKKYPNLLPGCEIGDTEDNDYGSKTEEKLKTEKNAKQHFISLLNYLADQKQFLTMMEGKNSEYTPETLRATASYIKKNGIKIYGFTTIADKETLLKLSKQNEVYEIYTEEVR